MTDYAPPTEAVTTPPELLFAAPVQARETDERYTPAWIFAALGEAFDLDPASPPLGISQVPTAAVWTKDDDGLTRPWHGFVWCNPPFSHSKAWADRFLEHGNGIWLGPVANGGWHDQMTRVSDAMILLRDFAFIGINHAQKRSSMPLSMHGFGARAVAALERFAEMRPAAGVLLERSNRIQIPARVNGPRLHHGQPNETCIDADRRAEKAECERDDLRARMNALGGVA